MAIGLGIVAFIATDVLTFYGTTDMAKDGPRNRKFVALIGIAGGIYLALKKNPLIGACLAVGAGLAGFGNMLDLFVLRMLPAKSSGATAVNPPAAAGLGAVAVNDMRALQYEQRPMMLGMGAVQYENMQAVQYDNMQGWETMGDPVPPPPWENENPFGNG
jgi:hypothetical protein